MAAERSRQLAASHRVRVLNISLISWEEMPVLFPDKYKNSVGTAANFYFSLLPQVAYSAETEHARQVAINSGKRPHAVLVWILHFE